MHARSLVRLRADGTHSWLPSYAIALSTRSSFHTESTVASKPSSSTVPPPTLPMIQSQGHRRATTVPLPGLPTMKISRDVWRGLELSDGIVHVDLVVDAESNVRTPATLMHKKWQ
jgi:hypothetical protein